MDGGGAVVDTVYWNWGVMNLRCFAFDLDGNSTMDDFYRYTLSDVEPTETREWDDPTADPLVHWLRKPFDGFEDILEFSILLKAVPAGQRTVTVAVADEALAESRLTLTWEVRAPQGQVLLVADNSSPSTRRTSTAGCSTRSSARTTGTPTTSGSASRTRRRSCWRPCACSTWSSGTTAAAPARSWSGRRPPAASCSSTCSPWTAAAPAGCS